MWKAFSTLRREGGCMAVLVINPEAKEPLGSTRNRWEEN
jgi:hypothetical protein